MAMIGLPKSSLTPVAPQCTGARHVAAVGGGAAVLRRERFSTRADELEQASQEPASGGDQRFTTPCCHSVALVGSGAASASVPETRWGSSR